MNMEESRPTVTKETLDSLEELAQNARRPHLKRPRSQREPTTNFERYNVHQEQLERKDAEFDESMSLFMGFVEAAANQQESSPQKRRKDQGNSYKAANGSQGATGQYSAQTTQELIQALEDSKQSELVQNLKRLGKKAAPGHANSARITAVPAQRGATTSKGSRPWTAEEERTLMRLVDIYGHKRWSHIAQLINGRTGKQCRERWLNHLRPNIKKDEWSAEEELILAEGHSRLGTRWSSLAKLLNGRTENAIKNHWNATLRCKGRLRSARGSSRGNKPSVLKEYLEGIQKGQGTAKALELAFIAEKADAAMRKQETPNSAKQEPTPAADKPVAAPGNARAARKQNQPVNTQGKAESYNSKIQKLKEVVQEAVKQEMINHMNPNAPKTVPTTEAVPLLAERMQSAKVVASDWQRRAGKRDYQASSWPSKQRDWAFQHQDLGKVDWHWHWVWRHDKASVRITERAFCVEKDAKKLSSIFNQGEEVVTFKCVGSFDHTLSSSQFNNRLVQSLFSLHSDMILRSNVTKMSTDVFFSKNSAEADTAIIAFHLADCLQETASLHRAVQEIKVTLSSTSGKEETPASRKRPNSKQKAGRKPASHGGNNTHVSYDSETTISEPETENDDELPW